MSRTAASGMATWGIMGAAGMATLSVVAIASPALKGASVSAETLGSPSVIAIQDNGKTFSYDLHDAFSVRLDRVAYPPEGLSCAPKGVIAPITLAPPARSYLASSGFQAIGEGTCDLTDGDFVVHIQVSATEGAASTRSGIRGLITQGPLCATQLGEAPCPNAPYQTTIGIYASSTASNASVPPVAKITNGADGTFEVRLPPGEYVVRAGLPIKNGGGGGLPCNWADVVVLPHAMAQVSLQCDTGIR